MNVIVLESDDFPQVVDDLLVHVSQFDELADQRLERQPIRKRAPTAVFFGQRDEVLGHFLSSTQASEEVHLLECLDKNQHLEMHLQHIQEGKQKSCSARWNWDIENLWLEG